MRHAIRRSTLAALLLALSACASAPPPPAPGAAGAISVEGGRIAFDVAGRGPALVLVNGGGMDLRQWDAVVPALARRFRVVRWDPRGWGRSPVSAVPFSQAEDLRALLDSLGIGRAHLVGLSWGGGVALDFTLAHPQRVDRLVLAGAAVGGYPWSAAFGERGRAFAQATDTARVQLLLDDPYFSPGAKGDARLTEWIRGLLLANTQLFHLDPRQERPLDPPAFTRLEEVAVPTLVLAPGVDHPDLLASADSLGRRIPGARHLTVAGAGHMIHMERPAEFAGIVADFLLARESGAVER